MNGLEVQNQLLWLAIYIYCWYRLACWWKTSSLKQWADEGSRREEAMPVFFMVFLMFTQVLSTGFVITELIKLYR